MAYAGKFIRMTVSGILGPDSAPSEIWANNLSLVTGDGVFPTTRAQCQAIADSVKTPTNAFYGNVMTAQGKVTNIRIAMLGTDGRVLRDPDGAYLQADSASAVRTGLTARVPFQTALVVSLHTPFAGPTGRGRIYVPVPYVPIQDNGQFGAADLSVVADAAKTWIDALNGAHGGYNLSTVVASQGSVVKALAPAFHHHTTLSIGDVPDTQRRRRNALDEKDRQLRTVSGGGTI